MKKILVPTDFTEAANNALDIVLQISQKSDQEVLIILLNVIDPENTYLIGSDGEYVDVKDDSSSQNHLIERAGGKLESIIEKSGQSNLSAKVEFGNAIQIINDLVESESIDLVCIGTHSSSVYEEMLFSSTTDRVIRTVNCPVLTVRCKVDNFKANNLVFATNLTEDHTHVIPQIKEMQRLFGSTIHIVYINTPVNFYNNRRIQEAKDAFISKYGLDNYTFTIYNDFTVETGIAHFSEDANADIIALAAHHLNDLLDYSISTHTSDVVIDETTRPVLTFSI